MKRIRFDGTVCERSFINGITRAETSVIDGAIRDNFMIRIGMKNLSVENFKMVFGVSKDESILEREKGSRLYFYRWQDGTIWNLLAVLRETITKSGVN